MEPIGRLIKSEEIQEGKTRCPGAQEENRGKEAGAKARARSDSSDADLRKFRRQDRRSIDTANKALAPETERPPRGGPSEIRSGVLRGQLLALVAKANTKLKRLLAQSTNGSIHLLRDFNNRRLRF